MNIYIDSDTLVKIEDLRDSLGLMTDQQIADAVIEVSMADANGSPVAGAQDLPATLISGSGNSFAAEIPNTVTLTEGNSYRITATITAGGKTLTLRRSVVAVFKA